MSRLVSAVEVAKHNRQDDCWVLCLVPYDTLIFPLTKVIIHGKVFDLTKFLAEHPGGEGVILKYAGRDATAAFDPIHPKDILTTLPPGHYVGDVDPSTGKIKLDR